VTYNYGRIESKPSLPMTRYDVAGACDVGRSKGPRGIMQNAQTHCVQLPNPFAFARGATGRPIGREDFVQFAEDLILGQGELIMQGWQSLDSTNTTAMRALAERLGKRSESELKGGTLKGLRFNNPRRFLVDLACMLRLKAASLDYASASESGKGMKPTLAGFAGALSAWQKRTAYQDVWDWPHLAESLGRLQSLAVDKLIRRDILKTSYEEGATPIEKVANSLGHSETLTPNLIQALNETLQTMP
jgi:hypothetical protein